MAPLYGSCVSGEKGKPNWDLSGLPVCGDGKTLADGSHDTCSALTVVEDWKRDFGYFEMKSKVASFEGSRLLSIAMSHFVKHDNGQGVPTHVRLYDLSKPTFTGQKHVGFDWRRELHKRYSALFLASGQERAVLEKLDRWQNVYEPGTFVADDLANGMMSSENA